MGAGVTGSAIRGLDHAGLPVTDLAASLEFFVTCLGARVIFRLEPPAPGESSGAERLGEPVGDQFSLAMLELGGGRIELVQWWRDGLSRTPSAGPPGGAHLALEVADVQDVLRSLRATAGVTVLGEPVTFGHGPTPGLTNAFLRTPGGVLLELVNWTDM